MTEVEKMRVAYEKAKSDVTGMLLHHVTTVDLTVSDSVKQSMQKFVSEQS